MNARVLVVDDSATIRKIVCAVLGEAGFSVATSCDGADALERVQRERFDLVLVDFVMPRLNGFQFAQAARSIASLATLPLVLMSARAESIADRFVSSTGAAGWIAKPFTPVALLDTVRAALATEGDPLIGERAGDERGGHSVRSAVQPVPLVQRRGAGVAGASVDPAEAVARALLPALEALKLSVEPSALAQALQARLAGRGRGELAAALEELTGTRAALEGNISQVGIVEVYQLLSLQSQTGVLRLDRGAARPGVISIAIRQGLVDGGVGVGLGESLRFGRFLHALGISLGNLERAAAAREPGELLGERLVREGHADDATVRRALETQTRELVYESLTWSEGRFRFERGQSLVGAQRTRLGLASDAVLMEGARRIDEWRVMRALIPNDGAVFARSELAVAPSDDAERAILAAIDGVRDVRELERTLALGRFELRQALCRLIRANALSVAA